MINLNRIELKFPGHKPIQHLEINLPNQGQLSDEEFFLFCQTNKNLKFERTAQGNIIVMTPTGMNTGSKNGKIFGYLFIWNLQNNYGEVYDSSTGFTLPDTSVLSPDVSIIAHDRINQLTAEQKDRFAPICPEFVVELKSPSDQLDALKAKMQQWLTNGAKLGWLIDPSTEKAYIYRPGKFVELIDGFNQTLSGETMLPGFEFALSLLK